MNLGKYSFYVQLVNKNFKGKTAVYKTYCCSLLKNPSVLLASEGNKEQRLLYKFYDI